MALEVTRQMALPEQFALAQARSLDAAGQALLRAVQTSGGTLLASLADWQVRDVLWSLHLLVKDTAHFTDANGRALARDVLRLSPLGKYVLCLLEEGDLT